MRAFRLIVLVTMAPALVAILLVRWSGHPDLYDALPSPVAPGATPINWRTLEELLTANGGPAAARPDLFASEVHVRGYMIPAGRTQKQGRAVNRFLLIPDAGNWPHGPHLDPGELMHVRLKAGATTPLLENKSIAVHGKLVVQPAEVAARHVVYHLVESAICP
ncbi:MAG: DUF3299 domain-containing protein [Bryobacteraceae bacterium]